MSGGSIPDLSANPGTVIEDDYMYNNNSTVALYLDEGSRYLTVSGNVVQDAGGWAFTNANPNNNTDDSTFSGNWFNGSATEVATGSPHDNVLSGNVQVSGYSWPSGAEQVVGQAGVQGSSSSAPAGPITAGDDSAKCVDDNAESSATAPGSPAVGLQRRRQPAVDRRIERHRAGLRRVPWTSPAPTTATAR